MKPKTVFFGYLAIWAICVILCLISLFGEYPNILLLSISFGILIAGNIVYYIQYKCPHCDRHLFNRVAPWHYCPYCGNHLDAEPVDKIYDMTDDRNVYKDEDRKRSDGLKIQ